MCTICKWKSIGIFLTFFSYGCTTYNINGKATQIQLNLILPKYSYKKSIYLGYLSTYKISLDEIDLKGYSKGDSSISYILSFSQDLLSPLPHKNRIISTTLNKFVLRKIFNAWSAPISYGHSRTPHLLPNWEQGPRRGEFKAT